MGITHEWNGTVLTITSDSGTSSADLKGEKGDTGVRGPQGSKGEVGEIDTAVLSHYATLNYVGGEVEALRSELQEYTHTEMQEAQDNANAYTDAVASGIESSLTQKINEQGAQSWEEMQMEMGKIKDYVVEEGTNGIWTYRKWASGISECWGTTTLTVTGWTEWGSVYESAEKIDRINFPENLFIATPFFDASATGTIAAMCIEHWGEITNVSTPMLVVVRPSANSGTLSYSFSMEARGRWQ